jgi:membrane protein YdbS with pleckstrin-like domain
MEILLLGIYSFFVWLIFIKFKWLPWNTTSQVTVAIIPIVALTVLILVLNVVARRQPTCASSSTRYRSCRRCEDG